MSQLAVAIIWSVEHWRIEWSWIYRKPEASWKNIKGFDVQLGPLGAHVVAW